MMGGLGFLVCVCVCWMRLRKVLVGSCVTLVLWLLKCLSYWKVRGVGWREGLELGVKFLKEAKVGYMYVKS